MNKCIAQVVKTMPACITSSLMTGRLGSEYLAGTLQFRTMVFAPLAAFLFASADSGKGSPVTEVTHTVAEALKDLLTSSDRCISISLSSTAQASNCLNHTMIRRLFMAHENRLAANADS